jgi:murein DD-endopeptidase MepM/ murein hydrolase activator NlpD
MFNKIYLALGVAALLLIVKNTSKMKFTIPTTGRKTSRYGNRTHPVTGKRSFHNGLDIAAAVGTPIVAPLDGTVKHIFEDSTGGKQLVLTHANGFQTGYAHLNAYAVAVGQTVKQGDLIGYVGRTGAVTGPHLHFSVKVNNKHVNPENYV